LPLVDAPEQFDWVIIEEAAKATGPDLVGALMLSGRRLLIGDHYQLPPFEADRLVKILRDQSLVLATLNVASQLIGPIMREGELEEMGRLTRDSAKLKEIASLGLRLLEPFRTFVEDDERRAFDNSLHRPISATLTEQRRMDPAIATIISEAFYKKRLKTEAKRALDAETEAPPFVNLAPLPASPVVAVNVQHVSSSGDSRPAEGGKPRVAQSGRGRDDYRRSSACRRPGGLDEKAHSGNPLALQGPSGQALQSRGSSAQQRTCASRCVFAGPGGQPFCRHCGFVSGERSRSRYCLVGAKQSHTGAGALGFLRDRRRMNVALSRAKAQLILVGSLGFLREAVRGVNPDAENQRPLLPDQGGRYDRRFVDQDAVAKCCARHDLKLPRFRGHPIF
jgi:hypothetical protein